MNGICRRFQCHISGMMPIGIVANLEIVHIQQCDPRRADGLADDLFVIAAVVGSCQRVPIKLFLELLLPCSPLLGGFVHRCSLIFGQLFQLLIHCGKGCFLFVKFFDQLLLALFVIVLDLGKCIHVLTFSCIIYIVCVLPLRKRACPLFIFGGG